jgi:hypothetical protein
LWGLCLLGLVIRAWLAERVYPMTGDPLYSYTYRATLIAAGRWEGVYLMWHPPGYPLLVAALTTALGNHVPPYWVGVGISLGCYLGLFWVVDRLVARRARYPGTRLVSGSFIALYETLFVWAVSPLTEPVYLLTLYGAVLVLDRDRPGRVAVFAGALLGAAFTFRMEAVAPAVGLGVYLAVRGYRAGGWRAGGGAGAAFVAGWLAAAGWLVAHVDYLRACSAMQSASYTIAPAHGLAAQLGRAAECAYHAVTVWLPFALVLPYWVLIGSGLVHRANAPGRPVLHPLLLAVVLPSLVAVGWTIMHKRTASFLYPAAALWVGLGAEVLARRWAGTSRRAVGPLLALVVAATAVQAARVGFSLRKMEPPRQVSGCVAAEVLADAGAEPGPVWAFGSEPDVYALRRWPIVYPFFDREKDYNRVYAENIGDPSGFIAELRSREFRYLVFVLSPAPPGGRPGEPQPFSDYAPTPDRADLERIAADPGRFGLEPLGIRAAEGGRARVHVYRLR